MLVPFILAGLALLGIGCTSTRKRFPENPEPDDVLAKDPCSVKKEPEITWINQKSSFQFKNNTLQALQSDMDHLRRINPNFLCGLERIELLGKTEFHAANGDPHSNGHYSPESRVIRIKKYSRSTLFHEIGHHLHNLGGFSSSLNHFIGMSWARNPHTSEWEAHNKGNQFFVRDYAETDPLEDVACTFSAAFAHPLTAGLHYYISPAEMKSTPVGDKVALMYSIAPFPLNQETVKIQLGETQFTTPSQMEFSSGNEIHFYKTASRSWTSFSLKEQKVSETSPALDNLHPILGSGQTLVGTKTQGHTVIIISNRKENIHGPAMGLKILNLKTGKSEGSLSPSGKKDNFIGELIPHGQKLAFFTRNNNRLEINVMDLKKGTSQVQNSLKFPQGFIPLHVVPFKGVDEFMVFGALDHQQTMQAFKVQRNPKDPKQFILQAGATFDKPNDIMDQMNWPVKVGERIIFPFSSFHFFSYHPKKDQFSLLNPQNLKQAPMENLKSLVVHEGQAYAVGQLVKDGPTAVVPINFEF